MIQLVRNVIDRVKAMFTLDAMLDLEQQFATRQAERKAELIRIADRYEREGMAGIAADLRRQADELSEQRPLQTVVPFLTSEPESPPSPVVPRRLDDRRDRRPKLPHLASTHSPQRSKGK
jgi:hypothetical protein